MDIEGSPAGNSSSRGGGSADCRRAARLQLVANLSDECVAGLRVVSGFDAEGRAAVNYAQDAATVASVGHNCGNRICGRAENRAHLKAISDAAEDIDWVGFANHENEDVSGADSLRIGNRDPAKLVVVGFDANQA